MRDIEAIYQEMMQVFSQRAGYLPADACDLSVRLYAMAAQVQALYAQAELNQMIPPELYGAVAEVLVYIFKLNDKKQIVK